MLILTCLPARQARLTLHDVDNDSYGNGISPEKATCHIRGERVLIPTIDFNHELTPSHPSMAERPLSLAIWLNAHEIEVMHENARQEALTILGIALLFQFTVRGINTACTTVTKDIVAYIVNV